MVNHWDDDDKPSIKANLPDDEKPPLGPVLDNGLRRALIGWITRTNTSAARKKKADQLWCWVDASNHLMIYISEDNRGYLRGMRYDTGLTNFSRIRM